MWFDFEIIAGVCQHLPDWLLLALHFKFFLLFELTEPQISSKEKNSVKHLTYIRLKNQVNDFPKLTENRLSWHQIISALYTTIFSSPWFNK